MTTSLLTDLSGAGAARHIGTGGAPNQKWLADMTYVPTKEGWLYLALVLDLYARKLVGWAMSETMPQELTLSALDVALGWRDPDAGLVHHSDRGSQYAAKDYRSKLKARGITVSMSRKGDCWDNAQRLGLGKAKANTVGSQIAEVAAEDTDLVGRRLAPAGSRFEPDLPFHGAASCTSKGSVAVSGSARICPWYRCTSNW